MTSQNPPTPYGSAGDLPSLKEIEAQLALYRSWRGSFSPAKREEIEAAERNYRKVVDMVDAFYALLGERNWIFTDDLRLTDVEQILETSTDPAEAERKLIDYYKANDRIDFALLLLNKITALKPRMTLIELALKDFRAGRYYSTVLVLLAVMDGFVQDVDINDRKNLNARPPEDMVPWDSVAGHHLGLTHAHRTFLKGCYKTDTADATELYRNGIMHGMVVNFDNDVIAAKAWNRLFALADWARSREKRARPPKATPTRAELLEQARELQANRRLLRAWTEHQHDVSEIDDERTDLDRTCIDFLQQWERGQWGLLGGHFMNPGRNRTTVGKRAELAKRLYSRHSLSEWTLHRIHHKGAAMAEAYATVTVNGARRTATLRWTYTDGQGGVNYEWQHGGRWVLAQHYSDSLLDPATETTS
ncbi:hypothetical protein [Rhodococcus sp. JS3073]|uniref:hypothetical protein n=1 Tax=Rhodococcus sp. JS3073 TaxID=3002901 RepID=UPI00228547B4|nr:hypothetical protein [Rhodococcus sp. JS3073]WAM19175.1 hypothetical protein OYT95_42365 [Rhodococcus sp. JS3073]